jgi:hypothetical protein
MCLLESRGKWLIWKAGKYLVTEQELKYNNGFVATSNSNPMCIFIEKGWRVIGKKVFQISEGS